MRKTTDLVKTIISASFEQNSGINQISNAINQLNQITQQSTAISEEIATGSHELARQASDLRNIVSYFKPDNNFDYKDSFTVIDNDTKNDPNLFE